MSDKLARKEESPLAKIGQLRAELARANTPKDAVRVAVKADALRRIVRALRPMVDEGDLYQHATNESAVLTLDARRKAGGMLDKVIPHQGGRPNKRRHSDGVSARLADLQIDENASRRWQALARMPDDAYEKYLDAVRADGHGEIVLASAWATARSARTKPPPDPVETPGFATGPFQTLVIDPPWPVEKILVSRRYVEEEQMDYPTWSLDRIREELPINRLANPEGCHVYLWVTHRFLPEGLELFKHWGVRYECLLTWIKPTAQPLWWKFNTEHVLFGKVGALAPLVKGQAVGFTAPQQRHSHKPEEFYQIVRTVSPEPRYTLFDDPRDGFEAWGVVHVPR